MIHPARQISFDDLFRGLENRKTKGLLSSQDDKDGLRIYCYTRRCVYDQRWDDITLMARGLILDLHTKRVVATPFPKFFNLGEYPNLHDAIPDLPFEVFAKLDGSLIVIFNHNDRWRAATKGSFESTQAKWAQQWLDDNRQEWLNKWHNKTTTLLAEAIYPENRIVYHYDYSDLVLLAAYFSDGSEYKYEHLRRKADCSGWSIVQSHKFASISDLLATTKNLKGEEGFVIRFVNGVRIKVKSDEYMQLHRLISGVTPLAIWEIMFKPDILSEMRQNLPEEFHDDFDNIAKQLTFNFVGLNNRITTTTDKYRHMTDKELGLILHEFPSDIRPFIFPCRKGQLPTSRGMESLRRAIRPTNNQLAGYEPSVAIRRIENEN